MIIKFLLGLIAGSADAIIALFQRLDATAERFLVQHDQDILDLENEILAVRDDADQRIAQIRAEIAERMTKAATVLSLKNSLNQGASAAQEEPGPEPDPEVQDSAAAPEDTAAPVTEPSLAPELVATAEAIAPSMGAPAQ